MKKTSSKTEPKILQSQDTSGSDFVWAAVSILTLPVVALSLTGIGLHPALAFLAGGVSTVAVVILEAIIRGKTWIFSELFKDAFGHHETAFRLLVGIGGVLLILQTAFVLQILRNPGMDSMLLNLILQKQCGNNPGPMAHVICPIFKESVPSNTQKMPLVYSLEQAAKNRLLPSAIFGSCAIVPLEDAIETQTKIRINFFAFCRPWSKNSVNDKNLSPVMRIINAEFIKNTDGFYTPTIWQESAEGEIFNILSADQDFISKLNKQLIKRHAEITRIYSY
jgi:hypothetical protein